MEGRRSGARLLTAVVAAAVVALAGGGAAEAGDTRPRAGPSPPAAVSPTPAHPAPGRAPDGTVVGGVDLRTRGVVVAEGSPPLPADVVAPSWLVADAGSGQVLAARDPHGRFLPASTLKALTLLTLLPVLDPAQVVVGTVEDETIDGTRVGLVAGGRYPVRLLYEALMLASGNDAANALARAAGGERETLEAMNETARSLGAFDTVAGTPSGLDAPGQSSSVYDLALIFRALLDDPRAVAILRTPVAHMPPVPGRSAGYQIQNKNPLLADYPGNLGAKNGFTQAARHGFVTAAERGGRRLIVSLLGSEATPLRAPEQAARLLDWGFAVPAGTVGVGRLIGTAEAAALATPRPLPRRDDREAGGPSPPVAMAPAEPGDAMAPAEPGDAAPPVPALLGTGIALLVGTAVVARRLIRPVRTAGSPAAQPTARRPPPAPRGPEDGRPPPPTPGSPSTPP